MLEKEILEVVERYSTTSIVWVIDRTNSSERIILVVEWDSTSNRAVTLRDSTTSVRDTSSTTTTTTTSWRYY